MNSTIRDSVTNYHFVSMQRTKIRFYGWKVIMSQLKSLCGGGKKREGEENQLTAPAS